MACVEGPSSLLGQSAPGLLSGPCSSPDKKPKKRTCLFVSGSSVLPGPLPLLVQPVKVLAVHFLPVERESETQGLGQTLAPVLFLRASTPRCVLGGQAVLSAGPWLRSDLDLSLGFSTDLQFDSKQYTLPGYLTSQ